MVTWAMNDRMPKKFLILGGGISGLGAAWRLAEKGYPVEVIESQKEEIGGLAATVKKGPYRLDYGPHFFLSEKPGLITRVTDLFDEELPAFKRSAQLYFHGRFYNYPLTARNVLLQMPVTDAFLSGAGYFGRLVVDAFKRPFQKKGRSPNFEQWAKSSFGDYLFKLFFKPYTEQFWQIPCSQLSPDSMPTNTRLSFFKTLRLLFVKEIVRSSMSLVERETTLLLRYPRQGIGEIPEKIANEITRRGGNIHKGWRITEVFRDPAGRYKVTASGQDGSRFFEADHVISTIPLTDLVPILKPSPPPSILEDAGKLGFLSFIVVYLIIKNREVLQSSYLYQLGRPYNRIADMNRFCPDLCPEDENMLALEYTCHKGDALWESSEDDLFDVSVSHLEKDGILKREEVRRVFALKEPSAYPIYRSDYKAPLENILNFVGRTEGLDVVGRAGRYMYMDMDQCLEKAFDLVDALIDRPEFSS